MGLVIALAGGGLVGSAQAAPVIEGSGPAVSAFPLPPLPPPLDGWRGRAQQAKERFDRKAGQAPDEVASWGMDEATGKMVVDVVGGRTPATDRFTADSDPAAVEVRTGAPRNRLFADVVGGQTISGPSGGRCSIGVSARNGDGRIFIITAGHCTDAGRSGNWRGPNGQPYGPAVATNFPTDDFGEIVATYRDWRATGKVQGGPTIVGSTEAGVGAQVCRSGFSTGYRCGVLKATNQTVNYGGGDVVYGLTETTACAEPGDSGGTFVTPSGQAQGVTSGGNGNCTQGGTTYFQPIDEALRTYGLTLVTGT